MVCGETQLRRGLLCMALGVTVATSGGCRAMGGCLFDWFFDTLFDTPPVNDELNKTWREGGGFNNPNVERLQRGEKPKDFGED